MRNPDDDRVILPDQRSSPYIRQPRSRALAITIGVILLLVAAGIGWYWLRSRNASETPQTLQASDPGGDSAAAARRPIVPPLDLPSLDASDALIRELVARLSTRPQLAAWLVNDDLVRRFVRSVADLAEGVSPGPHLRFLTPSQAFRVQEAGDRLVIDPASYGRYDLLAATFGSIDNEGGGRLYHQLHPLFERAWEELGIPGRSFDEAVSLAIGNLLAVEVPDGPAVTAVGATAYEFADPAMEARNGAAKHLIRMGPDNARRVQNKLGELAAAAGIQVPGSR